MKIFIYFKDYLVIIRFSDCEYIFRICMLKGDVFLNFIVYEFFYLGKDLVYFSFYFGVGYIYVSGI